MAEDLRAVGVRVEELLAELRTETDPTVLERAEELVRLLVELYGAGLERALALVAREPSGDGIIRRLAQDELLGSLFVLHGIHPVPVEDRIQEALRGLRPQLGGTRVALLSVDADGVAHCELSGGGCGSGCGGASTDADRGVVEKAILDAAPEVVSVTFGAVTPAPAPVAVEIGGTRVPVEIGRSRVPVEIGRTRGGGGNP